MAFTVGVSDTTPPTVTIASPADGARFALLQMLRQRPRARFSCTDDTGVASCSATVDGRPIADGAPLPATFGAHTLTVTATDDAGNTHSGAAASRAACPSPAYAIVCAMASAPTPQPRPARPVALALAALAAIAGLFVALAILGRASDITATDLSIARELRELAPGDAVRSAMRVLTHLGATDVALPLVVLVAVLLYRAGDRRAMIALVGAYAATQATVTLVKVIVERARPDSAEAFATAGGYAFPSGHSATAAALYGALALIAARHGGARARRLAIGAAVVVAGLVGITRVYLGVHYPSDVLAGWLLGAAVLAVVWRLAVTRAAAVAAA